MDVTRGQARKMVTWTKQDLVIISSFGSLPLSLVCQQKKKKIKLVTKLGRDSGKMSKLLLLHSSHLTAPVHRQSLTAILSASKPLLLASSPPSLVQCRHRFSHPLPPRRLLSPAPPASASLPRRLRDLSTRAFDDSSTSEEEEAKTQAEGEQKLVAEDDHKPGADGKASLGSGEDYPSGEFEFEKVSAWKSFVVKLRMLIAFPWERVRKGSVLTMKLRGQVCFFFFLIKFVYSGYSLFIQRLLNVSVFFFLFFLFLVLCNLPVLELETINVKEREREKKEKRKKKKKRGKATSDKRFHTISQFCFLFFLHISD